MFFSQANKVGKVGIIVYFQIPALLGHLNVNKCEIIISGGIRELYSKVVYFISSSFLMAQLKQGWHSCIVAY